VLFFHRDGFGLIHFGPCSTLDTLQVLTTSKTRTRINTIETTLQATSGLADFKGVTISEVSNEGNL